MWKWSKLMPAMRHFFMVLGSQLAVRWWVLVGDGFRGVEVFGGPEGEGEEEGGDEGEAGGVEEEFAVVDGAIGGGELALEGDEDPFGGEVA